MDSCIGITMESPGLCHFFSHNGNIQGMAGKIYINYVGFTLVWSIIFNMVQTLFSGVDEIH